MLNSGNLIDEELYSGKRQGFSFRDGACIGLDVSKTQIEKAKGQLVTSKFDNVEFR
jgi:hypothetical protein